MYTPQVETTLELLCLEFGRGPVAPEADVAWVLGGSGLCFEAL